MIRYRFSNRLFNLFFILGLSIALFSCNKNTNNNNNANTPNVYVEINIYSNTPEFFPLNTVGGWIYKAGGTKGIIIYRTSQTDFVAFERSCPYDGANNPNSIIKVMSDNLTGKDSICGSKFYINSGVVSQGPSTLPLRAYHATFDGNLLHVYN